MFDLISSLIVDFIGVLAWFIPLFILFTFIGKLIRGR